MQDATPKAMPAASSRRGNEAGEPAPPQPSGGASLAVRAF